MRSWSRAPRGATLIVALLLAGGCAVVDDSTRLDSSPFGFGVGVARAWSPKPVLSTRDLRDNMYPSAGIAPCVLLVNTTGGVGCSTSGEAAAAVQRFTRVEDVRALDDERMLLLPPALFPVVLAEYLAAPRAVGWRRHARGILVETGDCEGASCADPNAPVLLARALADADLGAHPFSPGDPYPQAQLRPDADTRGDHVWNPHAIGAVSARFDEFPIALLDRDGTDLARTFANENRARRFATPDRVLAVDARMSAADTSIECLRRGNCLPVGGYSVVAAVGESEVEM